MAQSNIPVIKGQPRPLTPLVELEKQNVEALTPDTHKNYTRYLENKVQDVLDYRRTERETQVDPECQEKEALLRTLKDTSTLLSDAQKAAAVLKTEKTALENALRLVEETLTSFKKTTDLNNFRTQKELENKNIEILNLRKDKSDFQTHVELLTSRHARKVEELSQAVILQEKGTSTESNNIQNALELEIAELKSKVTRCEETNTQLENEMDLWKNRVDSLEVMLQLQTERADSLSAAFGDCLASWQETTSDLEQVLTDFTSWKQFIVDSEDLHSLSIKELPEWTDYEHNFKISWPSVDLDTEFTALEDIDEIINRPVFGNCYKDCLEAIIFSLKEEEMALKSYQSKSDELSTEALSELEFLIQEFDRKTMETAQKSAEIESMLMEMQKMKVIITDLTDEKESLLATLQRLSATTFGKENELKDEIERLQLMIEEAKKRQVSVESECVITVDAVKNEVMETPVRDCGNFNNVKEESIALHSSGMTTFMSAHDDTQNQSTAGLAIGDVFTVATSPSEDLTTFAKSFSEYLKTNQVFHPDDVPPSDYQVFYFLLDRYCELRESFLSTREEIRAWNEEHNRTMSMLQRQDSSCGSSLTESFAEFDMDFKSSTLRADATLSATVIDDVTHDPLELTMKSPRTPAMSPMMRPSPLSILPGTPLAKILRREPCSSVKKSVTFRSPLMKNVVPDVEHARIQKLLDEKIAQCQTLEASLGQKVKDLTEMADRLENVEELAKKYKEHIEKIELECRDETEKLKNEMKDVIGAETLRVQTLLEEKITLCQSLEETLGQRVQELAAMATRLDTVEELAKKYKEHNEKIEQEYEDDKEKLKNEVKEVASWETLHAQTLLEEKSNLCQSLEETLGHKVQELATMASRLETAEELAKKYKEHNEKIEIEHGDEREKLKNVAIVEALRTQTLLEEKISLCQSLEKTLEQKVQELAAMATRLETVEEMAKKYMEQIERVELELGSDKERLQEEVNFLSGRLQELRTRLVSEAVTMDPTLEDEIQPLSSVQVLPLFIKTIIERCQTVQDAQKEEFDQNRKDLSCEMLQLSTSNQALKEETRQIQFDMTALQSLAETTANLKVALEEKVSSLQEEVGRLTLEKKNLETSYESAIAILRDQLTQQSEEHTEKLRTFADDLSSVKSSLGEELKESQIKMQELGQQKDDLEKAYLEVKGLLQELQKKLSDESNTAVEAVKLQQEKDDAEKKIVALQIELDMALQAKKCLSEDILNLNEKICCHSTTISELKARITATDRENDKLQKDVAFSSEALKQLKLKLESTQLEIQEISNNIKTVLAASEDQVKSLKSEIESLNSEKEEMDEEMKRKLLLHKEVEDELNTKLHLSSKDCEFLREENERLKVAHNLSKTQLGQVTSFMAELQSKIQTVTQEKESLEAEIGTIRATLKIAQDQTNIQGRITNGQATSDTLQAQIKDLTLASSKFELKMETLKSEKSVLKAEIERLESELTETQAKMIALQNENKAISEELEKTRTDKEASIQTSEELLKDLNYTITNLKSEISKLIEKEGELRNNFEMLRGENETILKEKEDVIANCATEFNKKADELKVVSEERSKLELVLSEKSETLVKVEEQLKNEKESFEAKLLAIEEEKNTLSVQLKQRELELERLTDSKRAIDDICAQVESLAKDETLELKSRISVLEEAKRMLEKLLGDKDEELVLLQKNLEKTALGNTALEEEKLLLENDLKAKVEHFNKIVQELEDVRKTCEKIQFEKGTLDALVKEKEEASTFLKKENETLKDNLIVLAREKLLMKESEKESVQTFVSELHTVREDKDKLQEEVKSLLEEKRLLQNSFQTELEAQRRTVSQLEDVRKDVESLKESLTVAEGEKKTMLMELESLRAERESLRVSLEESEKKLPSMLTLLDRAENLNKELTSEIDLTRKENCAMIVELKSLQSEKEDLRTSLGASEEKLLSVQALLNSIEKQYKELTVEMDFTRKQIAANESKLAGLESVQSQNQNLLASLEESAKQLSSVQALLDSAESLNKVLVDEMNVIRKDLKSNSEVIQRLNKDIDELVKNRNLAVDKNKVLTNELEAANVRSGELKDEVARYKETEVAILLKLQEKQKSDETVIKLTEEVTALSNEIAQLRHEVDTKDSAVQSAKSDLASSITKANTLESIAEKLRTENADLLLELRSTCSDLKSRVTENEAAKLEIEELREAIRVLKGQLELRSEKDLVKRHEGTISDLNAKVLALNGDNVEMRELLMAIQKNLGLPPKAVLNVNRNIDSKSYLKCFSDHSKQIQHQLANLKATNETLTFQIDNLTSEKMQFQIEVAEMIENGKSQEEQIAALQNQLISLNSGGERRSRRSDISARRLDKLEELNKALHDLLTRVLAALNYPNLSKLNLIAVRGVESAIKPVLTFAAARAKIDEELQSAKEQMKELDQENQELSDTIEDLLKRKSELEMQILQPRQVTSSSSSTECQSCSELRKNMELASVEISGLTSQCATKDQKISDLETRVREFAEKCAQLEDCNCKLKKSLDENRDQLVRVVNTKTEKMMAGGGCGGIVKDTELTEKYRTLVKYNEDLKNVLRQRSQRIKELEEINGDARKPLNSNQIDSPIRERSYNLRNKGDVAAAYKRALRTRSDGVENV